MKINAIQCKACNDIVFSRAVHDFRSCSCGSCSIDGGLDYIRVFSERSVSPQGKELGSELYTLVSLDLPVTKEQLYNDWNNSVDEMGVIKGGEGIVFNEMR